MYARDLIFKTSCGHWNLWSKINLEHNTIAYWNLARSKYLYIGDIRLVLRLSPLSGWKSCYCMIRSLSMSTINCCTRPHIFTSFARQKKKLNRLKKKFNNLELFFQSLANDNAKVNKTQRTSAKTGLELDSLSYIWNSYLMAFWMV